ncbi:MAG: hypothetical protein MRY79_09215 [Alphaproteobacteria bacterium]|nr:hypothetical protein [Alphaproteobacteria bacterium]
MQPNLTTKTIDRAMEKALAQAEQAGNSQEVLSILAQVHGRNPSDPIVATRYARALREDDQINAAARILEPFLQGDKQNKEAITEMAMVQLALGDHGKAELYAQNAINLDEKNARAYLALGTAQDAQKRHQDAEISFREGLRHWKGDPSPILNNLALNLASQGHLEEALSLLEKAKKLSPHRMELERNKRIISTLLETTDKRPPAPEAKPEIKIPEAKKKVKKETKPQQKKMKKIVEEVKEEEQKQVQTEKKLRSQAKTTTKTNIKLKSSSKNLEEGK